MKPVRLGVLGAGNHSSQCHGPALQALAAARPDRIELTAICDRDPDKAKRYAARFGFGAVFDDLDRMVAEAKLDGLLAITPVAATETIVARLLPLGLPLLIEKPPGKDSAAAKRLLELADQHNTPHMVSFNRRFNPMLVEAQNWLAADPARKPRIAIARMIRERRLEEDFITATGIHALDAVCALMGRPTAIQAGSGITPGSEPGGAHCAMLEFETGSKVLVVIAPDAGHVDETYELIGTGFSLVISVAIDRAACSPRLHIRETDRPDSTKQMSDGPSWLLDGTLGEMEAFIASIFGERPWTPTLADGVVALQIAEAIRDGAARQILLSSKQG